jgi:HPt (histidine-containing phosphotransfer) domain-containing protein
MDDYITKPASRSDIAALLKFWVSKKQSASEEIRGEDSVRISPGKLSELQSLDEGDGNFLRDILDRFETESVERGRMVAHAADTGDWKGVCEQSRLLASSASNFGASGVQACVRRIHEAVQFRNYGPAREHVDSLIQELDAVCRELKAWQSSALAHPSESHPAE